MVVCPANVTDNTVRKISLSVHLHRLPEVSDRDPHGAIFVNVPEEIPQA